MYWPPDNGLFERLGRLLNGLMDHRVLPFVGAGFSITALLPGDPDFRPDVAGLGHRALEAIDRAPKPGAHHSEQLRLILARLDSRKDLSRLTEIAQWLHGDSGEVLRLLAPERFADLEPSPAHRYLAYLAREGLLDEVISTNYDCCIERAYRASFGRLPADAETAVVIHDIQTYRCFAGRTLTHDGRPLLKVYKLNGCAAEYRAEVGGRGGNADARILLTERELQDFEREQWARDLLRERARRQALLFVGFGSEEPQVRHTVLALMQEFQTRGEHWAPPPGTLLEQPNAPFMAVFDPTPSFSQLQVMAGYVRAHKDPRAGVFPECMGNVFTGLDGPDLGLPDRRLPADDLMRRLFQAAFGQLLRRHAGPGSPYRKWLTDYTAHVARWEMVLTEGLYPDAATWPQGRVPALFGRWPALLEPAVTGTPGPCRLWHWLWRLQTDADPPSDWYLSLRDDALFLLSFLTVVTALIAHRDWAALRLRWIRGVGLELHLQLRRGIEGPRLYLAHQDRPIDAAHFLPSTRIHQLHPDGIDTDRASEGEPPPVLLRILDLPSLTPLPGEGRVFAERRGADHLLTGRVRVGRYLRMPVGELLRHAGTPGALADVARKGFAGHRPAGTPRGVRLTRIPERATP